MSKQAADRAEARLKVYKNHGCLINPYPAEDRKHRFYAKSLSHFWAMESLEADMEELYGTYKKSLRYPVSQCKHDGACKKPSWFSGRSCSDTAVDAECAVSSDQ